MYSFILENEKGEQLTFNQIGGDFTIDEIDGLSPADATINTSQGAYIDGELFNSSKVNMRTLQVAFAIERNAAQNRIAVYKVLKPKQFVRAYYQSSVRNVYIDGYVKSVDITHYDMKQVCTVSIVCPKPFWRDATSNSDELNATISTFRFPFAALAEGEDAEADAYTEYNKQLVFGFLDPTGYIEVENNGDVQTGLVIELHANGAVSNPKIIDYNTGDYMQLNFNMQAADSIVIDTNPGEKSITLVRNGQEYNAFNSLMRGSTWLQLDFSGGAYAYEVGSGVLSNLVVTISHENLYEGV